MNRYPEPYKDYLILFHTERDYFECHEVLEEYWKSCTNDPDRSLWVGLIQIAVGLYHQRRGNIPGAVKMLNSAKFLLPEQMIYSLGLNGAHLQNILEARLLELANQPFLSFTDMNLPIIDKQLEISCLQQCERSGLQWMAPSDLSNTDLIHKHTLRDRSEVIEARSLVKQKRLHSNAVNGRQDNNLI